jgi:hypothetical protein
MMKSVVAQQLGNQVGQFLRSDSSFPGYLRVRVDYPLNKPLVPELSLKIKGRGQMQITIRYESVPHFCFTCGQIGHAAANCDENSGDDLGVKFGEELRASPPRRVSEIPLKVGMHKATRPLFQVADQSHSAKPSTSSQKKKETSQGRDGEGQTKGGESATAGVGAETECIRYAG